MLVRVCDICGEQFKSSERYFIINSIDTIYPAADLKDSIRDRDICIDCARSYYLNQIFDHLSVKQN